MSSQSTIREEELKNRVAAAYFGKYDCTRIVGNIDFCVSPKRRDPRQMTFIPDAPILWAEAKNHPTDIYRMLAQLILTIKGEMKGDIDPPRFVGSFDNEKIAFVEYHYILPIFNLNDFNWTQTPSAVDNKTVETVRGVIPSDKIVVFRFGADDAEIKAFIARNFTSGDSPALATPIDRNNFTFIYQKWRNEVMPHIDAPWDVLKKKYALYDRDFFLAEMNVDDNGTPEVTDDRPAADFYITFDANARLPYCIHRKNEDEFDISMSFGFKPGGIDAYVAFWRRYKRPPKREYWDFIVSRLDLLVPQDVRERKGSFFTPAIWVEKSQQYLAAALGENWQENHYVWDCCAGTGNLLAGLTNKYRIWASTLDQQDVDVMRERIKNGANLLDSHVFRFDFLNDPFDKLPQGLKDIIADPEKCRRLVIYINPPYAEAGDAKQRAGTGQNKSGVSFESAAYRQAKPIIKTGGRELFALFLFRIFKEIPGCMVGQFSTLKHVQAPNFAPFRDLFRAELLKCFMVPADTFDNVKGKFPIGFFVWRLKDVAYATGSLGVLEIGRKSGKAPELQDSRPPSSESNSSSGVFTEATADVYDRDGEFIGTHLISSYANDRNVIEWLRRHYDRQGERIAYLRMNGTNVQNNLGIYLASSLSPNDLHNHFYAEVTKRNVLAMSVYLAIRTAIEATWQNDREQYLVPNEAYDADDGFQVDCLVYALFSGQNRVKSSDGVNHWIPFTEEEVGAKDCFESHFMSDFINGRAVCDAPPLRDGVIAPYQDDLFSDAPRPNLENPVNPVKNDSAVSVPLRLCVKENLSPTARAVLDAGRELWKYYHAHPNATPNASYYDIRLHFQGVKRMASGKEQMNATSSDETYNTLLAKLRAAHKVLASQIAPKVYEYGFLKR